MTTREKGSYAIKAVENALDLLEVFSDQEGDISITGLSARLGMNKSYVFRLLATFEHRGYVEQGKVTGKYRAGLSAYEVGRKFLSHMGLLRKVKPIMETLAQDCNEAVYLVVPGKKDILLLEQAETNQRVQVMPLVGNRYRFEDCSAGLLIKAFKSESEQVTEQLQMVRSQEFCVDQNGLGEGIASASVPIFAATGEITGCLCLVAPDFRISKEELENTLLTQLKTAGQLASARLGYFRHYSSEENLSYAS